MEVSEEQVCRMQASLPHAGDASGASALPFLVVRGAGDTEVNGRYAHVGVHNGKPKYKKVDGEEIIYYEDHRWFLNLCDSTSGCIYKAERDSEVPPSEWQLCMVCTPPAPSLSFGSFVDLQVGDEVTFVHCSDDVDWSGCPEQARRLSFGRGLYTVSIDRIQGDWFYPRQYQTLVAPLAALGSVKLMGREHGIAGAESLPSLAASSSAALLDSGASA